MLLLLPPVLVPFVKVTRQWVTIIRPVTRTGFPGCFGSVFMNPTPARCVTYMKIALHYQHNGPTQGYVAYGETSQGYVWLGGFSNYVNRAEVCRFAEEHNHQLVEALPAEAQINWNPDWARAWSELQRVEAESQPDLVDLF